MTDSDLNPEARALAAEVVSGTLTLEQAAERAGVTNQTVAKWVSQLIFASTPSLQSRARTLITFSQPQIEVAKVPVETELVGAPVDAELVKAPAEPELVEAADIVAVDEDPDERESLYERPTLPRARPEIDEQAYSLVALTNEQADSIADVDARLLAALDGTRTVRQIFESLSLDAYTTRDDVQRLLSLGYLLPSSIKPVSVSVTPSAPPHLSYISISPFKPQRSRLAWTAVVAALGACGSAGYVYRTNIGVLAGVLPPPKPLSYAAKPLDPPATVINVRATPIDLPSFATKPAATNHECPEGMAFIPAGKFSMGVDSSLSQLIHSKPVLDIEFAQGFCIDRVEVTVAAYEACVQARKCTQASALAHWSRGNTNAEMWSASRRLHSQQCNAGPDDRGEHPINCISWPQANTYCTAQGYHLPSEEQWEYAARGVAGRTYPWGNDAPNENTLNGCGKECDAWHAAVGLHGEVPSVLYAGDDGYVSTAPAGSFAAGATPEGVLDLAGNVAEWTSNSWYSYADVVKAPTLERPSTGAYHVVRGGGFNSNTAPEVDASMRIAMPNATFSHAIGFRCAAATLPK